MIWYQRRKRLSTILGKVLQGWHCSQEGPQYSLGFPCFSLTAYLHIVLIKRLMETFPVFQLWPHLNIFSFSAFIQNDSHQLRLHQIIQNWCTCWQKVDANSLRTKSLYSLEPRPTQLQSSWTFHGKHLDELTLLIRRKPTFSGMHRSDHNQLWRS